MMKTFIMEEGSSHRGMDNIVSMLYLYLVQKRIIDLEGERTGADALGQLVVACDNCSAQNKNKGVIKFCMWLVDAGYVKKVTLLFLIKGHTKNHCDKSFNLLKQGTKGEDIWDAVDLDRCYTKKNEAYIDLQRLDENNIMRGWAEGLATIYRDPKSGSVMISHEFTFGLNDDKCLYEYKEFRDAPAELGNLRPTSRSNLGVASMNVNERRGVLIDLPQTLKTLPKPGLSSIKANELQNKIRPIVPPAKQYYYEKRLTPELQAEWDKKKNDKNRQRAEKEKNKKQKIAEANTD